MTHGTEAQRAAVAAENPRGRQRVVSVVQRAGRRQRPRRARTRGEKRGGFYRVTGQKVWSSVRSFADMGIALVRTDAEAPPHKGISMLAIPMDATGVDVRPLRQMTGEHEFNEVFLDDVEVPVEHLIGPENDGWRVANTTLANERGASFIWKEQVLHEVAIRELATSCACWMRDPILSCGSDSRVVDRCRAVSAAQRAHAGTPRTR